MPVIRLPFDIPPRMASMNKLMVLPRRDAATAAPPSTGIATSKFALLRRVAVQERAPGKKPRFVDWLVVIDVHQIVII